jgi:hypothetical protein
MSDPPTDPLGPFLTSVVVTVAHKAHLRGLRYSLQLLQRLHTAIHEDCGLDELEALLVSQAAGVQTTINEVEAAMLGEEVELHTYGLDELPGLKDYLRD